MTTEGTTAPVAPEAAPAPEQNPSDNPSLATQAVPAQAPGDGSDTPASPEAAPAQEPKTDAPQAEAKPAEDYELDFGELPAGVEINKPMLDAFKEIGKKHGIAKEAMQDMAAMTAQFAKAAHEQNQKDYQDMSKTWEEETKKALGPKWEEELSYAAKFRQKFGSKEFDALLNETRMGNHPALVTALIKAGKALSEDRMVGGDKVPTGQEQSPQAVLAQHTSG
jgi:hypothetical protein